MGFKTLPVRTSFALGEWKYWKYTRTFKIKYIEIAKYKSHWALDRVQNTVGINKSKATKYAEIHPRTSWKYKYSACSWASTQIFLSLQLTFTFPFSLSLWIFGFTLPSLQFHFHVELHILCLARLVALLSVSKSVQCSKFWTSVASRLASLFHFHFYFHLHFLSCHF